jgi:hypothetical protein
MCFPLSPVHVLFWFFVHRAPKRQRIYRAKLFVFFGTIRLYTKFELLMSITFFRNLFLGAGSDGGVPFVVRAVPVCKRSYATHYSPPRDPTPHAGHNWPRGGPKCNRPASLSYSDWRWFATVVTLMILHDLWRRPDHFKLSADFLNLCGLLLYSFG